MFGSVKRYITGWGYRRRYPTARLDSHALLHRVTLGAEEVTIAGDACLTDVATGSSVTVHRGCSIQRTTLADSVVVGPEAKLCDVTIGAYSYLAGHSTAHNTHIGRFCSVSKDLLCGLGEHPTTFVSTSPVFFSTRGQCNTTFADRDAFGESSPVEIGNDVWIGARVFVRDGLRIGHGAIIAAGAVVVDDVPDYAVVAGIPAKVIRMRFSDDQVARLLALNWWDWDESRLRAAGERFACEDIEAFLEWAMDGRECGS